MLAKIQTARGRYRNIYVAYADCGTGGRLDDMLAREGVERIGGNHCYEFFAGTAVFEALSEAEPGTFYLTDYLARHFDRLTPDQIRSVAEYETIEIDGERYFERAFSPGKEASSSLALAQWLGRDEALADLVDLHASLFEAA